MWNWTVNQRDFVGFDYIGNGAKMMVGSLAHIVHRDGWAS